MFATGLFELKGDQYLLAVDYFSQYPEVYKISSTTSNSTIAVLESISACHEIPKILWGDNGPQYASKEFSQFAKSYSLAILPAVQGIHKIMDKWKGWYGQSKDC